MMKESGMTDVALDTPNSVAASASAHAVDPITTQVIRSALVAAAEEMHISIVQTAYNPLIYEIQDFAVALLSPRGEMMAQGASLPLFLPCLSLTIQKGVERHGLEGFSEDDVLIANDPYSTGTHISDTSIYMPIFYDGELQAFAANTAHWADIGGKTPGGWCPDSVDVIQEGMLFPHLKLYEAGQVNQTMYDFIMANNRFPDVVRGDLGAQIAACKAGVKRYQALCDRYGAQTVHSAMEQVFDQSDAQVRRMLGDIPDGKWTVETLMDHDGVVTDVQRRLACTVEIAGDEMNVDFTGTDETANGPINIPLTGARAAVEIAFKSATVPHDPANEGHTRALTVTSPENTITNPAWPAPCDSYGYAALLIIDLVSEALSNALPERCPAHSFMLFGGFLARTDPRYGKPFICIDPLDGGGGALPYDDGADALIFHGDGDVPNMPAEVCENRFPVKIEEYALHTEEYGIGKYRGGLGVVRRYRVMADNVVLQIANERTIETPRGLFGGGSAGISRVTVRPGEEDEHTFTQRVSFYGPLSTGDVLLCKSAGGGGYGNPLERDPERVLSEVRNGLLTCERALEFYGVVLDQAKPDSSLAVDEQATAAARAGRSG